MLYFLSWSGFLVSFMMRNDINIALVSMVRPTKLNIHTSLNATENIAVNDIEGEFDWSSSVQSIILGSFYGWYVISQVS